MISQQEHQQATPQGRANRWGKRLILFLVAGAVCVILAGLYLHFSFGHSIGSGPAGPSVNPGPFRSEWTTRPVLLVGLGDSVTAGFGAPRGYGYFDRLVKNPVDEFQELKSISLSKVLPALRSTNLAVSGSVSSEVLRSQLPSLAPADSNTLGLVMITTGGNDLIHNYGRTPPRELAMYGAAWESARPWIETFETRLAAVISAINQRFPGGCHIFLANIYDPTDGAGDIQRAGLPAWPDGKRVLAAYNQVIQEAAERHQNVHLVNFHDAFLGHGLHCGEFWSRHYDSRDPHYWYYSNLEDPNERGYDAIRRLFLNEMAKAASEFK
jgi:lysophospholipase L1-like esterase